ncbi:MAG: hypothetical protein WC797_04865, partial [Candidatus Paceibacterota bacterium]
GRGSQTGINLIYSSEIADDNVSSKEKYISFEWVEVALLKETNLLPRVFAEEIFKWSKMAGIIYLSHLE